LGNQSHEIHRLAEDLRWKQFGEDIQEESVDVSGYSLVMSADGKRIAVRVIVDVPGYDAGNVRVYDYDDDDGTVPNWKQGGQDIVGDAITTSDLSNSLLAKSGDGKRIAVGAPLNNGNDGSSSNAGHVRVYEYNDEGSALMTTRYHDDEGTEPEWTTEMRLMR
jgi:hypothetical protein